MAETETEVRRASPWPLPVVLGLVLAELGVLYGSLPVSVGGSLLLGGSVVGILRESGYAATLSRPALAVGGVFAALGGLVLGFTGATDRGTYVVGAGAFLLAAGAVLWFVEQ
jgi:hypothetical protein